jgi:DNA-binding winged helix-turn-helix (wHTH) protein
MLHSAPVGGWYVFDRFRLSADGALLLRDGIVVPLAPKVLQTLLVLLQRPGEVVRKEQLLQAVWPDSFVEDTGLTRNVSLLRQSLGDAGPRLIATVARVGYRFTASVEHLDGAAVSGVHAAGSAGDATAEQRRFGGWPRQGTCDASSRARARRRRPWRHPRNHR